MWENLAGKQACAAHLIRDFADCAETYPEPRPGQAQVKQQPGREMLEFCRNREADVLRFTTDTAAWPTNNLSERGVRPLNTQQKISGRSPP